MTYVQSKRDNDGRIHHDIYWRFNMCENLVSNHWPTKSFYRKDVEAILGSYVDGSPLDRIVRELEPMGSQVFDVVTSQATVVGVRGEVNLVSALLAQTVRRFKREMKNRGYGLEFGHDVMLVRFGNDPVPLWYKLYGSDGSYISFVGTSIRLKYREYITTDHYDEIWHRDTYLGNFDS